MWVQTQVQVFTHVQAHTRVRKYLLSKRKTWSDTYAHTDTQTQSLKLYHASANLKKTFKLKSYTAMNINYRQTSTSPYNQPITRKRNCEFRKTYTNLQWILQPILQKKLGISF